MSLARGTVAAVAVGALAGLVGCPASGHSGGPNTGAHGMGNLAGVHEQAEHARVCTAIATMHAAGCAPFAAVPSALLDDCTAVDHVYLTGYDACLGVALGSGGGSDVGSDDDACAPVRACAAAIDAGSAAPYAGPVRACEDTTATTIPVGVSAAELAQRYGAHDKVFAQSPSTVKKPIEVCGIPEELDYLMRTTCADGSHPFAARAQAGLGSAGLGGRCGRPVDHVVVPCAEHPYDVYLDAYRCPVRG